MVGKMVGIIFYFIHQFYIKYEISIICIYMFVYFFYSKIIGHGLGKNNDGIAAPIKVNYKFDTSGLGHNKAEDIMNTWWTQLYNNAASNLDMNKDETGSTSWNLKSGESVDVSVNHQYAIK